MALGWQAIKDEFTIEDIGAPLLTNLAKGIYTPEAMLREYVQNAGDSYYDLREKTHQPVPASDQTIDIYIVREGALAIQDKGIGMDLEDIRKYKRIAYSAKGGSDRAGFRGIGIWAGYSACDELVVETTKLGDTKKYRLTLEFAKMRKAVSQNISIKNLLDQRFRIEVSDAAKKTEHYTQVVLSGLNEEFADLLKSEELERIAQEILPCRFSPHFKHTNAITKRLSAIDGYQEFAVQVSGTEIFKKYHQNCEEPEFEVLKRDDEEYGFVWYCQSSTVRSFANKPSNFRLRAKNIAVGGPGMYSAETGTQWGVPGTVASGELLDWYFGEVHITHPDVKPNTPRSELELDTESRRAITCVRAFYSDRIAYRRAYSNVNSHRTLVDTVSKALDGGQIYDPKDRARHLKALTKYDKLAKSKVPAKDSTSQEKTSRHERKILKALEAKEPVLGHNRQKAIDQLTGPGGASVSVGKPEAVKTSVDGAARVEAPGKGKRDSDYEEGLFPERSIGSALPDYEQVLAEIVQAIEKRLADQDDLASELCEGIQDIFKDHGLLVVI
ncbi:ATP-binding protein [Granulicella sp. dw_53]|uniref:ATP-binding protein n=1 Tax=Granulicella sp. dw_53 TaxID=2719792 RepID=UPI001BD61F93|nr:ATP-binding protein [Granulicella sp. dw_53]